MRSRRLEGADGWKGAGTFFVVVHGWNGAENLYDICLGLASGACP